MQLKDKVIIITGGCQGLGLAMAEYLAGKGAKLALVDLNKEKLHEAVASCKSQGVEARAYLCNVANEEQVTQTVGQIAEDFGAIANWVELFAEQAGVAADTVVWAKELARYGIRVAGVAPGFIETEMVAAMKPEALERMTSGIPLRRMGKPAEIAHSVAYILENDYYTGRILELDGGLRL